LQDVIVHRIKAATAASAYRQHQGGASGLDDALAPYGQFGMDSSSE